MDIEKAQRGIVYIDEIDKLARKGENPSLTRDVGGESVVFFPATQQRPSWQANKMKGRHHVVIIMMSPFKIYVLTIHA